MRKGIEELERELREAGHDVERDYGMGGLETYDGDGWIVRVDGEVVASAASIGALEERVSPVACHGGCSEQEGAKTAGGPIMKQGARRLSPTAPPPPPPSQTS